MTENRIKKLDQLLKPSVLGNEKHYLSHTEKRLTAPGENYGSLMLAVEIKLKNLKTGGEETLNAVAKLIPPNEFLQKVFNTQVSFRGEIEFYKTIVPYLQQFQLEQGSRTLLDCFPKFLGGRLNLNPGSAVVDDDAVLLLENLKDSGFDVANRYVGFDLRTTQVILTHLAQLHAIPIAIKLLKPEQFERELLQPFFQERLVLFPHDEEKNEKTFQKLLDMVRHDEYCMSYAKRIREVYDKSSQHFRTPRNRRENARQPFATIVHTDFWVNNIMLRTENIKMLDFQSYEYSSPGKDVIFFLYSSVEMKVVEENYNDLLRLYYNTFVQTLKELKCSTELFSFDEFENEIKKEVLDFEFVHCLMMVNPIMAYRGSVAEIEDLDEEELFEEINSKQRAKSAFIVREFIKRNLI